MLSPVGLSFVCGWRASFSYEQPDPSVVQSMGDEAFELTNCDHIKIYITRAISCALCARLMNVLLNEHWFSHLCSCYPNLRMNLGPKWFINEAWQHLGFFSSRHLVVVPCLLYTHAPSPFEVPADVSRHIVRQCSFSQDCMCSACNGS